MKKMTLALATLVLLSTNSFAANKKSNTTSAATKTTTQTVKTSQSSTDSVISLPKAANGFTNEFLTHFSSSSLSFGKSCSNCDSVTTLNFQGSYLRYIQDKIQAGVEAGLNIVSGGGGNTTFGLMAIGVYNFETSFANSPFVKIGLGLESIPTSGDSKTEFGFFVGGGKRFSLFQNVSYAPEARLSKVGDIPVNFEVTLLNFSFNWN